MIPHPLDPFMLNSEKSVLSPHNLLMTCARFIIIVQVGTPEGRIKISGRKGVEVTLKHSTKIPTLWLGFLPHRGGLVRVTQEGDVQLFSVAEQCWASGILIEDEVIHDVGIVQGEQYLLLACGSGNVRVVSILDIEGEIGMGPAADLQLQPYQSTCFVF